MPSCLQRFGPPLPAATWEAASAMPIDLREGAIFFSEVRENIDRWVG